MWVDNNLRKPAKEGEYSVRRKSVAQDRPFFPDVCAWIPNPYTKRTHGVWTNIRSGGKLYDILEWWDTEG